MFPALLAVHGAWRPEEASVFAKATPDKSERPPYPRNREVPEEVIHLRYATPRQVDLPPEADRLATDVVTGVGVAGAKSEYDEDIGRSEPGNERREGEGEDY